MSLKTDIDHFLDISEEQRQHGKLKTKALLYHADCNMI